MWSLLFLDSFFVFGLSLKLHFFFLVSNGIVFIFYLTIVPFPAEMVHNVSQGMGEVSHSAAVEQHIVVKALYPSVRHFTVLWCAFTLLCRTYYFVLVWMIIQNGQVRLWVNLFYLSGLCLEGEKYLFPYTPASNWQHCSWKYSFCFEHPIILWSFGFDAGKIQNLSLIDCFSLKTNGT